MKIIIVAGARPNFIKIAPLFEEFKKERNIQPILVHTGQHYDYEMSQAFFQDLNIPKPKYNLGVGSGSHAWQTAKIMERLEKIVLREKPSLMIVVGDVNSTLAGALVARKINVPLAHIEAGLRSYDKTMPEEINRVLTDQISDFLFCPTETAVRNLKKENIRKNIYNVGDIMYDALLDNIEIAKKREDILKKLKIKPKEYFLLTIHRVSNADNPENLKKILNSIVDSKELVIFPVHPRTKKQINKANLNIKKSKIKIISPVGYLDALVLEKNARKIITDSGGVQKESFWLKVPCITLRKETEWVETVKNGWNVLVGTDKRKIQDAIKKFNPRRKQKKYFGSGNASQKITKIIMKKNVRNLRNL